ncbi:MAG: DnaJ domain-containing protein [Phormidesmis sp.]
MPESPGDYYQRLRLPNNASRREIRAAFRRLARQYHPDLHPNQPGAVKKFRALREAYEVLIDRVQRQYYDQHYDQYLDRAPSPYTDRRQSLVQPETPEEFYIRGVRYTLSRRFRAALGDYNKAIELDGQFAEAYLRRAEVRYLIEDDSGVLADCQRAIALNSTEAKTYFYQGMARYRLDYVQSAIAAFTDAITCDPDDAQYYYRRGLAYQDLNQMDEAARDFRRAAHLYRNQGNLGSYEQIHQYLRQFGTAGRSRPIKLLGRSFARLSRLLPRTRQGNFRRNLARAHRDRPKLSPPNAGPNPRSDPRSGSNAGRRASNYRASSYPRPTPHFRRKQTYWAPGISSRPGPMDYPPRRGNFFNNLFLGMGNILRLLSNPAGEMVPLYLQLSPRQTSLVGYGLAVLANLLFISGGIHYTTVNSWLVASWLWASGGMAFVAMVTAVALTRTLLRIRGLWVADIFTLGTALVPLGMFSVLSAAVQFFASNYLKPSLVWLAVIFVLLIALWAISHTLLTLHSGFSRIHTFPDRLSAWLTPTVLVLGLMAGVGTWGLLSTQGLFL